MEVQLADSETSLLSLIRTEVQEPPAPSISLQRSLREIPLRQPRDKQRQRAWARAHMGLGALAAAIALLLLAAPPPVTAQVVLSRRVRWASWFAVRV